MDKHKSTVWVAAALLIAVLAAAPAVAAPNIKEKGTIEAVEESGRSVVIMTQSNNVMKVEREHRGTYPVSSYAAIIDGFGRKITIDKLSLPAKVEFEVEYTANGPVIKKIREIPQ